VALNIAALGANAHILGIVGKDISSQMDAHGQQLNQLMTQAGVSYDWALSDSGTICKLRVLSHHQQLIRMDFENPVPEAPVLELVG